MDDLILKILPSIKEVVQVIATGKDDRNDLEQELIIKCYDNEGKVRRLFVETGLKKWLFLSARNLNIQNLRHEQTKRKVQPHDLDYERTTDIRDTVKPTAEMMVQLNEVERMWIELWIACNFNYLEMQRRSGQKGIKNRISRQHAKKKITEILIKWKQLDIYLQE